MQYVSCGPDRVINQIIHTLSTLLPLVSAAHTILLFGVDVWPCMECESFCGLIGFQCHTFRLFGYQLKLEIPFVLTRSSNKKSLIEGHHKISQVGTLNYMGAIIALSVLTQIIHQ